MTHEQIIWTLGIKSKKADKSISWTDKIPNLADPNIIIIDLGSLTQEILDIVSMDELKTISTTIYDKLFNGGTIIFITSHIVYNKSRSFSNYHLCPLKITVNKVPEGTHIIYDERNPFANYLENVKRFDFYLKEFDSFENKYDIFRRVNGISALEIGIERIRISRIDDNAGRVLGGIYNIDSTEQGPLSGDLIFLPPPTEIQIDKLIDDIIDTTKKITLYGYTLLEANPIKIEKQSVEIKPLQEGNLENKYKILINDHKKSQIYSLLFRIFFTLSFYAALFAFITYKPDFNPIFTVLSIIISIFSVGYVIAYLKFIKIKSLNKMEKTFIKFFNVYLALKTYEYRPNYNIDKVINSIDVLSDYIETWYGNNAPKDLSELPKSIVNTLRNIVIPSIKAKNIDYQILKKHFFNYSARVYDLEPDVKMLNELDLQLKSLQTESFPKSKIKKKPSKYSFFKLISISPISGLIIYFSFVNFWPDKTFESTALALGSALTIMMALVQLTKHK
jgi:hypothetical protein